ncbi:hypothetical protein IHC92_20605 [Photobacterium damselae subsp. damselae]|uniref:hypothetical protein n=1 Tax=Photobacterium damselae TaxID=38293 RepID=UPI001F2F57CB|nr:hypothetical protein [Photobacterium damselae]UKA23355.1 hypothetical protein IHC92_20605 [Photobacterium damselae subsp. damselae]
MAITLRPTDEDLKLIEYAKKVTNEATSSKALLKICVSMQITSRQLQEEKKKNIELQARLAKLEKTINHFKLFTESLENL